MKRLWARTRMAVGVRERSRAYDSMLNELTRRGGAQPLGVYLVWSGAVQ